MTESTKGECGYVEAELVAPKKAARVVHVAHDLPAERIVDAEAEDRTVGTTAVKEQTFERLVRFVLRLAVDYRGVWDRPEKVPLRVVGDAQRGVTDDVVGGL